jgi:hypothetical protein
MPTIQEQVLAELCKRLSENETFPSETVEKLRKLLTSEKPLKPADLVEVLSAAPKRDLG